MATVEKTQTPTITTASELPAPYEVIKPFKAENSTPAVAHVREYFTKLKTPRRYNFTENINNPPDGKPPKSYVTAGYTDEVEALDPHKPHTMDLVNFINIEISQPMAELLRGGLTMQIHMGTQEQCLSRLAEKGYTKVHKVLTPLGPQMFLAENPKTNEMTFALSRVFGMDEVQHYQAIARHLKIPSGNITTIGYEHDYDDLISPQIRDMRDKPDAWVIGGWIMGKYLEYRAKIRERHELLLKHWMKYKKDGEPLSKTIRERIEQPNTHGLTQSEEAKLKRQYTRVAAALKPFINDPRLEELLTTPSENLHYNGQLCRYAFDLFDAIGKIGKNHPKVEEIPHQEDGRPFPMQEQTYFQDAIVSPSRINLMKYKDSQGNVKTLAVTDNPYGDISYYLTREILRHQQPEDIVFVGSSGSIVGMEKGDPIPVGEISVPIGFYDSKGNPINRQVENALLETAEDQIKADLIERDARKDEMHPVNNAYMVPTSHVKIPTPLFETKDLVQKWRQTYEDTVDVEAAEVVRAIEERHGEKPRFAAMTYTEDILGLPGHTLGETDRKLLEKSRSKVLDVLIQHLDIREILPVN